MYTCTSYRMHMQIHKFGFTTDSKSKDILSGACSGTSNLKTWCKRQSILYIIILAIELTYW